MSLYRTNGEKIVALAARFAFFCLCLPLLFAIDWSGDAHLSQWPILLTAIRCALTVAGLWGLVGSFFGFLRIATSHNAWFQQKARPLFSALTGPLARWIVLGALAAIVGALRSQNEDENILVLSCGVFAAGLLALAIQETKERMSTVGARAQVRAMSPIAHHASAITLVLVALADTTLLASDGAAPLGTIWSVVWLAAFAAFHAPVAEVGRDGLYIRGLRRRFVPFRPTDVIVEKEWGVEILRDERLFARLRYRYADADRRDAIAFHIRDAIDGVRTDEHAHDVAIYAAHAHTLATDDARDAGYRAHAVPREALWRIVETPQLEPRVRLHAARELRIEAEDGDDERLREIADRTAEPTTRRALSSLASRVSNK